MALDEYSFDEDVKPKITKLLFIFGFLLLAACCNTTCYCVFIWTNLLKKKCKKYH